MSSTALQDPAPPVPTPPLAAASDGTATAADPVRCYATVTFVRGAAVALSVALLAGLLAILDYLPSVSAALRPLGFDLRDVRPLHVTFAAAWIFLAGVAVVHSYLQEAGGIATAGDRLRLRIQVLSWLAAGIGIAITLPLGITTGREYVGFHPIFSTLILIGWACFAWNFWRVTLRRFWSQPVYVTMWGVSTFFFAYTFLEQHAWLLHDVFADPIVDRRIQWKATGTLVGSMNLLVYGTAIYIGEKLCGDKSFAQSRLAYSLFGIGLLNSFTNFAHHTYHLPQSHVVKWISFVISMLEILILLNVLRELVKLLRCGSTGAFSAVPSLLRAGKWWTAVMLFSSLLLSIPVLNTLVHGTYVVTGHAMGAMIGIDTMIVLGGVLFLLAQRGGAGTDGLLSCPSMRWGIVALNVSVAAVVLWLHVAGTFDGYYRYLQPQGEAYVRPGWLDSTIPIVFAITGTAAFLSFAWLLKTVHPLAFARFRRDEGLTATSAHD